MCALFFFPDYTLDIIKYIYTFSIAQYKILPYKKTAVGKSVAFIHTLFFTIYRVFKLLTSIFYE